MWSLKKNNKKIRKIFNFIKLLYVEWSNFDLTQQSIVKIFFLQLSKMFFIKNRLNEGLQYLFNVVIPFNSVFDLILLKFKLKIVKQ